MVLRFFFNKMIVIYIIRKRNDHFIPKTALKAQSKSMLINMPE